MPYPLESLSLVLLILLPLILAVIFPRPGLKLKRLTIKSRLGGALKALIFASAGYALALQLDSPKFSPLLGALLALLLYCSLSRRLPYLKARADKLALSLLIVIPGLFIGFKFLPADLQSALLSRVPQSLSAGHAASLNVSYLNDPASADLLDTAEGTAAQPAGIRHSLKGSLRALSASSERGSAESAAAAGVSPLTALFTDLQALIHPDGSFDLKAWLSKIVSSGPLLAAVTLFIGSLRWRRLSLRKILSLRPGTLASSYLVGSALINLSPQLSGALLHGRALDVGTALPYLILGSGGTLGLWPAGTAGRRHRTVRTSHSTGQRRRRRH